ncbi:hypothetical protein PIB30_101753 [Stylosanthes scabra]|uniref:Uncharacterized protein n=1 Tax=Stylosanthes scabra TaxID=79078 RepID=A0ABU6VZC4_9FABA|nr:hypothetical protein [Stylosanthes scabra]
MARNTGSYVIIIIILTIGVVICSENVEFQKTIIEIPSTTLYPTSNNSSSSKPKQTLEECVKNCRKKLKRFGFFLRKKMNRETMDCIFDCVLTECSLRFPETGYDSRRNKESCVLELYNKYTGDQSWLKRVEI